MDPITIGALAVLALLAFKRPSTAKPPASGAGGDAQPAAGGPNAKEVVAGATGVVTAVGGVVGALQAAGLFAGGGTAAAAGGGTAAAVGGGTAGTTAAESSAAAAGGGAAAEAGGVTAGVVIAQGAVLAVIVVIELAFVWFLNTVVRGAENFQQWAAGRDAASRFSSTWWNFERAFIDRICAPEVYGIVDPATGKPPPGIKHEDFYVDPNDNFGYGGYVPWNLDLPGAEQLRLYRAARYLAIQYLAAHNELEFQLYQNSYSDPNPDANPRGMSNARFAQFVDEVLQTEPWADQLRFRCACGLPELEAAARSLLVPNFDYYVRWYRFVGRVDALGDFAVTGWPGIRVFWPGDEAFNRQLVGFSGLGGAPWSAAQATGGWAVDAYQVQGAGFRWVAVDPVMRYGIDLQATRGAGKPVIYGPELLGLGDRESPKPSQAGPANYTAPTLPVAGFSGTPTTSAPVVSINAPVKALALGSVTPTHRKLV